MELMIRNMTQLVRIAGHVDCNDFVVLDLQRGGLQRIVLLDGEVVEVCNAEKHGQISRLTVAAANGDRRIVTWRPGMTIENQGEL